VSELGSSTSVLYNSSELLRTRLSPEIHTKKLAFLSLLEALVGGLSMQIGRPGFLEGSDPAPSPGFGQRWTVKTTEL
jgi:hypothetical protein